MVKLLLLSILIWNAEAKGPAETPTVNAAPHIMMVVTVKGMVCSFCAQGIEKKLLEQKEINKVDVDLDSKKITLHFKPGQKMQDSDIKAIITKAGYDVVGIQESK